MAKAVIFDFDGVITRTEQLHLRSFRDILRPFGVKISSRQWYSEFTGIGGRAIMELLFKQNEIREDVDSWTDKRRQLFMQYAAEKPLHLIRGLRGFLKELHSNSIPTAIASGSRRSMIMPILSRFNIQNDFRVVVGAEDTENKKPHPEPFLKAAELLGMAPGECIAIEDSSTGMQSAIAAGMETVCMDSPASKSVLLKYNVRLISSYSEFPISMLTRDL